MVFYSPIGYYFRSIFFAVKKARIVDNMCILKAKECLLRIIKKDLKTITFAALRSWAIGVADWRIYCFCKKCDKAQFELSDQHGAEPHSCFCVMFGPINVINTPQNVN